MYKKVKEIIDPVYMVGGCVRDDLLGVTPKDFDFCTPLTPEEIENAIRKAERKPYLVGKRFGTIGVKIDGQLVEITTFRSEKYIQGSRKPQVTYVKDITADLSRRDFTINAIAQRDNKYIDPFDGIKDIKNKAIRCVGKPSDRFKEDPLRLLRLCRFVAQLNFNVDIDTFDKAKQLSYKILEVSKERWVLELDKLLVTNKPSIGLEILASIRLLNYILPELAPQVNYDQNSPYHSQTLWKHTLDVVDFSPPDVNLRWAALLHDSGKISMRTDNKKGYSNYLYHELSSAENVLKYGKYLKWSNDRLNTVYDLVLNHMKEDSPLRKADNMSK